MDSPANINDLTVNAATSNSSYNNVALIPWSNISLALTTVSGRGYYSTTFQWPPATTEVISDAYIDLGAITLTVRVCINGNTTAPLDLSWA